MFINKTYKYKLRLSKDQKERLTNWINTCRAVYNLALETKIYAYNSHRINLSCFSLQKQLPELRKELDWIKDVPSESLCDVTERLDMAYKSFYKGGGFPKFANRDKYNSITFKTIRQVDDYIFNILKIGTITIFKDRQPKGELRRATIIKEIDGFYICILTRQEIKTPIPKPVSDSQAIGIDMGVSFFYVGSDGEFVDNPRFFNKYQKQLRIEQRSLARKAKGSNNRAKQKKVVAKLHQKIKRSRQDFLHKTANNLIKYNDIIIAEKLKLLNMTKSAKGNAEQHGKNVKAKSGLNRVLLDVGMGSFFEIIDYKTKWQGKQFVQINPAYTSQKCSCCGYVSKNNRKSQSKFICEKCGYADNADFNASKNIKSEGIAFCREREASACA